MLQNFLHSRMEWPDCLSFRFYPGIDFFQIFRLFLYFSGLCLCLFCDLFILVICKCAASQNGCSADCPANRSCHGEKCFARGHSATSNSKCSATKPCQRRIGCCRTGQCRDGCSCLCRSKRGRNCHSRSWTQYCNTGSCHGTCRLEESKTLLRNSQESIDSIARNVGFSNVKY